MDTNKIGKYLARGGVASVAGAVVLSAYSFFNLWVADGSNYVYERTAGEVTNVETRGWGIRWNPFLTRVGEIPRQKQITVVSSDNANLRSDLGEKYEGEIRFEYRFDLGETEEEQAANIESLIERFGPNIAREIEKSVNSNYQDPIEKLVQARAQTIAVGVLDNYSTDEFQEKIDEIRGAIREQLVAQLAEEDLPMVLDQVDSSGLAPGPEAQERIERIAAEKREGDRAQVVVDNSLRVQAAAAEDAKVFLQFAAPLVRAGFSEAAIATYNCQRLVDKADRSGIPFGNTCMGGDNEMVSVAIDPSQYELPSPVENAVPAGPAPEK